MVDLLVFYFILLCCISFGVVQKPYHYVGLILYFTYSTFCLLV
jgi:hypothetical protein